MAVELAVIEEHRDHRSPFNAPKPLPRCDSGEGFLLPLWAIRPYEEFDQALQEMGDDIYNLFVFKKSPLRIERKDGTGKIYFIGYGGSNMSRTKSIKPKHKLHLRHLRGNPRT